MTNNLKINIMNYVKQFGCVSVPQLRFMFRDSNYDDVMWYVKSLLFERILMRKDEKSTDKIGKNELFSPAALEHQMICARKSFTVSNDHIQHLITDSAWVAGAFGPDRIASMAVASFPTQLFLCTTEGKAYDVTVVYPGTQKATIQSAKKVFDMSTIPALGADFIDHIALVYNDDDAQTARKSGFFDYYAVMHSGMQVLDIMEA